MKRKKKFIKKYNKKSRRKTRRNPAPKYQLGDIYEGKEELDSDSDLTPYYVIVDTTEGGFILRPVRNIDGKWQYAGETFGAKLDRFGHLKGFKRGVFDRWVGWDKAKRRKSRKSRKSSRRKKNKRR